MTGSTRCDRPAVRYARNGFAVCADHAAAIMSEVSAPVGTHTDRHGIGARCDVVTGPRVLEHASHRRTWAQWRDVRTREVAAENGVTLAQARECVEAFHASEWAREVREWAASGGGVSRAVARSWVARFASRRDARAALGAARVPTSSTLWTAARPRPSSADAASAVRP